MRNRTCRGCSENFIPRAKAKHCSRECRRTGYLAEWENPERRRIQGLETREHWSDAEKRKLIVTGMLAAWQTRREQYSKHATVAAQEK
jgi:hypothetical protein